jgi:hypothetical protein
MGTSRAVGNNGCIEKTTAEPAGRNSVMRQGRSGVVDDQLNVPLEDSELLAEVELTTNLIIAASESEATLAQDDIDRLLGVEPPSIPSQKQRED